jgi:hypothetical protein
MHAKITPPSATRQRYILLYMMLILSPVLGAANLMQFRSLRLNISPSTAITQIDEESLGTLGRNPGLMSVNFYAIFHRA